MMKSTYLVLLLLASTSARAADYFVASDGSDDNVGSQALPWLTLRYAARQVGPSDTVTVRAGQYDGFQVTTSGTAGQPIVFQAFAGERPEIISSAPGRNSGINVEGASFVVIDGFRIDERPRAGIRAVNCDHITMRNNHTDNNGVWGIFTGFCDDIVIENNVTSNSNSQHGIYASNSADRPIIRGNVVFGNRANGIHMNGDISVGGDGVISDAIVENNIIYDNGLGGGSAINMDGIQDSIIRNNLIYNTHASGISLYRIDGGAPSTGNQVLNNTVLVASDGRWAMNIQDGSSDNTLRNNIFYNAHSSRGSIDICASCLPGLDSDYNVVMERFTTDGASSRLTLAQWQTQTGQDQNSLVADPGTLFVGPAGDDYRLAPASPAVDAGVNLGNAATDIEGTSRPQGAGTDIGAYESLDSGLLFQDGFEG